MTIDEYIKSKPNFNLMPYMTIYVAITELINDGYIEKTAFIREEQHPCGKCITQTRMENL